MGPGPSVSAGRRRVTRPQQRGRRGGRRLRHSRIAQRPHRHLDGHRERFATPGAAAFRLSGVRRRDHDPRRGAAPPGAGPGRPALGLAYLPRRPHHPPASQTVHASRSARHLPRTLPPTSRPSYATCCVDSPRVTRSEPTGTVQLKSLPSLSRLDHRRPGAPSTMGASRCAASQRVRQTHGVDDDRSPLTGSVEDRQLLAAWAGACAERELPLFVARHPDDDRPGRAVEAARAWARGEIRVGQARKVAVAAHAAARMASDPAARAAARSCGQAAGTAHMGGHARHAASYAAAR